MVGIAAVGPRNVDPCGHFPHQKIHDLDVGARMWLGRIFFRDGPRTFPPFADPGQVKIVIRVEIMDEFKLPVGVKIAFSRQFIKHRHERKQHEE